jgi:hypothetical protein
MSNFVRNFAFQTLSNNFSIRGSGYGSTTVRKFTCRMSETRRSLFSEPGYNKTGEAQMFPLLGASSIIPSMSHINIHFSGLTPTISPLSVTVICVQRTTVLYIILLDRCTSRVSSHNGINCSSPKRYVCHRIGPTSAELYHIVCKNIGFPFAGLTNSF